MGAKSIRSVSGQLGNCRRKIREQMFYFVILQEGRWVG